VLSRKRRKRKERKRRGYKERSGRGEEGRTEGGQGRKEGKQRTDIKRNRDGHSTANLFA